VYRSNVTIVPAYGQQSFPERGVVYVTWPVLNFGGPIYISVMAKGRALKFCTKGDYIESCQRDDKSSLKGTWFCSHDPFLYAHCVLRKNSPRHSVINNVVDDRLSLIATTALVVTLRLTPKLHRFDLSLYLLQSWLFITYRQQTDQAEFEHYRSNMW